MKPTTAVTLEPNAQVLGRVQVREHAQRCFPRSQATEFAKSGWDRRSLWRYHLSEGNQARRSLRSHAPDTQRPGNADDSPCESASNVDNGTPTLGWTPTVLTLPPRSVHAIKSVSERPTLSHSHSLTHASSLSSASLSLIFGPHASSLPLLPG